MDDAERMVEENVASPPLIEIRIETAGVVPAEVAGQILEEVARAFDRHAKAGGRRDLRLGVKRVDIGSLVIQLTVLGSTRPPGGRREARGFVEATAHLLLVAQDLAPGVIRRPDACLLEALRAPVTDGVADRVLVTALGAEAIVDRTTAARLKDGATRQLPPRLPSTRKVAAIESPVKVPARRELAGETGTVLDVKGRWYVRLEGRAACSTRWTRCRASASRTRQSTNLRARGRDGATSFGRLFALAKSTTGVRLVPPCLTQLPERASLHHIAGDVLTV